MRLSNSLGISCNFFGYGINGNFESNGNVELDIPENSGPCYYFFNDFILNEGHTLTVKSPCRGLYIYVLKTAIVNGTITMVEKGIYSPPTGEYVNGYTPIGMKSVVLKTGELKDLSLNLDSNGVGGNSVYNDVVRSTGGLAGIFSSGSGAGGAAGTLNNSSIVSGTPPGDYGGVGGIAARNSIGIPNFGVIGSNVGGAGIGNPTKIVNPSSNSQSFSIVETIGNTSGVLYFITNKLIVNDSHLFTTAGTDGHPYRAICTTYGVGNHYSLALGGGGSGGGCLTILYRDCVGSINANANGGKSGLSQYWANGSSSTIDSNTYAGNGKLHIYSII